jgi:hypothetical protein
MAPRSMNPIAQLVPKSRSMQLVPVEFKTDRGLMQSTLRRTRGGSPWGIACHSIRSTSRITSYDSKSETLLRGMDFP